MPWGTRRHTPGRSSFSAVDGTATRDPTTLARRAASNLTCSAPGRGGVTTAHDVMIRAAWRATCSDASLSRQEASTTLDEKSRKGQ